MKDVLESRQREHDGERDGGERKEERVFYSKRGKKEVQGGEELFVS